MTDEQLKQRDYHTGRKIVNGGDVKQREVLSCGIGVGGR